MFFRKFILSSKNFNYTMGLAESRWEDDTKMGLKEKGLRMWIGFVWLMIGSSSGLL
jgi:hypothetical protein